MTPQRRQEILSWIHDDGHCSDIEKELIGMLSELLEENNRLRDQINNLQLIPYNYETHRRTKAETQRRAF